MTHIKMIKTHVKRYLSIKSEMVKLLRKKIIILFTELYSLINVINVKPLKYKNLSTKKFIINIF